jgi:sec-independent protein translocase protein TatA
MGAMSPTHWAIVIGVLVLLFGGKKLPDLARSVGQSARLFHGEIRGMKADDQTPVPPLHPSQAQPDLPVKADPAQPDAATPGTARPR